MLTELEIIEAIGSTPKTPEMMAIEGAAGALAETNIEVRKRYACLSDKKVIITIEITVKDITTFHSQKTIGQVESLEELKLILKTIDSCFLKEIILYALTYKSLSAKDYHELIYYRRKFGPI